MKMMAVLILMTLSFLTPTAQAGAGATGGGQGATHILPFKMICSAVYQSSVKNEKGLSGEFNFDEQNLLRGHGPFTIEVTPICQAAECPTSKRYFVRASFVAPVEGKTVISSASTFVTKEERLVRFVADMGVCTPDCDEGNVVRSLDVTCSELAS